MGSQIKSLIEEFRLLLVLVEKERTYTYYKYFPFNLFSTRNPKQKVLKRFFQETINIDGEKNRILYYKNLKQFLRIKSDSKFKIVYEVKNKRDEIIRKILE